MGNGRIIFHVDMNAFFAAVEQKSNPLLRGKPILVGGNPNTRTVVAAASYEAKAYGVKSGMSLREARSLSPQAILVEGTPMKYVDTSQRIFALLGDYSPELEVFSIDEAFLDMTGTWAFFGSPEGAARSLKERIRSQFGLTCSVGIGPNKLLAKLACGMQKPDGLVRIREEEVKDILKGLPVEELYGIGERLKEHLARLGIITCGDLAKASRKKLKKRFGIVGELLHDMSRGIDLSPVIPCYREVPVKSMGHSRTLDQNTYDARVIRSTILSLSEQVGRRLRRDGYQGRTVSLVLRYSNMFTFSRQMTQDAFLADGYEIYRSALRILSRIDISHRAIRLVGVNVSQLIKEKQLLLLEKEKKKERLTRAMDRINDRFGEFTIGRAALAHANPRAFSLPTHGFLHRGTPKIHRAAPTPCHGKNDRDEKKEAHHLRSFSFSAYMFLLLPGSIFRNT